MVVLIELHIIDVVISDNFIYELLELDGLLICFTVIVFLQIRSYG